MKNTAVLVTACREGYSKYTGTITALSARSKRFRLIEVLNQECEKGGYFPVN
jgi:hypothetical protein